MEVEPKFKKICVFCGSSAGNKTSYRDAAIELGAELMYRTVKCTDKGSSGERKVEKEAEQKTEDNNNNNEDADADPISPNSPSVQKTQRSPWSSTKGVSMSISQADPHMEIYRITKDDVEKDHLSLEFTLGRPSWGIDHV
ncbi:hypothetical protein F2Q69_00022774 [Brassica cretica]|uniref:Uncharacterized protein n=1 Tax=Brassica cretica TaxID=69181 RepID=A0A8S9QCB3_BRACR|nr:hypothetical protein F2Q69_00022774 [Brassica cretica]